MDTRAQAIEEMYLRLLTNTLSNRHYRKEDQSPLSASEIRQATEAMQKVRARFGPLAEAGNREVRRTLATFTPTVGARWLRRNTWESYTLLEATGLANVEFCVRSVISRQVPGDLVECGVWRGGTCILMRGILKALGESERRVWVADSFQGLPEPDPEQSPLDAISHVFLKEIGAFAVSQEAVQDNFRQFDLLDEQVRFLPGWFSETLPQAPIEQIAVLRLDADYYDSTVSILESLYPKLSPGGFAIVDDYGNGVLEARRAVDEYRARHNITQPLIQVDDAVVYWEKA